MTKTVAIDNSEPIIEEQTGINVELLNRVADHIEKHSEQFDIDNWNKTTVSKPSWWAKLRGAQPVCKTTYCIAGWAVVLSGLRCEDNIPAQAQRLLGLTLDQAKKLFYKTHWPSYFTQSGKAQHVQNAWIAAERIRHFIATNGAE